MATKEEIFEIFDENNNLIGTKPRSVVHKEGLYHRSVNILVFLDSGQLIIQKRSQQKDVCPNKWDLSCAEHLQPGETYLKGALRGLSEELFPSVELKEKDLTRLRSASIFKYQDDIKGIKDFEITECWKLEIHKELLEKMKLQEEEVAEIKLIELDKLKEWKDQNPENFTPWFLNELHKLQL
jgi:isopentenyldiphosphate isomerase